MTLTFSRVLADGWALFRRDAALLLRIALPLVFLPAYAVLLLCDPPPPLPPAPRDQAAIALWVDAVGTWGQANALWYVAADAAALLGVATVALLMLARSRPTVGEALALAARRFLPFAAVTLLVALPVGAGMWLFILPGLWLQGRLAAALPAMARDDRLGPVAAIRLSWRMTRGRGLALSGAVVAVFLMRWFATAPLASADGWLRSPGNDNPAVLALVDALVALLGTGYQIAVLMIGVVAYRRLASSGT